MMQSRRITLMTVALLFVAVFVQAAYNESPMLQGKGLPPVDERLPENPAVVTPATENGQYGGTLRFGFVGGNPGWGGLWFVAGWENLVIWKPDFSGVDPNIAERWEVQNDARDFIFHLRKGMKWSDGEPFTAADITFYIEDILFNEELSPAGPVADWLPSHLADGFEYEQIDDYTVKFSFPQPNGLFLYTLATWSGRHLAFFPKHYLQQFHAKYNPDVDQLVAEADGVEEWTGLFTSKAAGPSGDLQHYFNLPELPVLFPWVVTKPLGAETTIEMERNPYYWKVDTMGNQLPYIDNIVGTSFQDAEARTFAMLNGDLDYIKDPGDDNRIIYHEAMEEGKPIAIRYTVSDGANTNSIHFNRNTKDPVKAEVFLNKDFRIGMSHAINREEIIDIVFDGQGEPAQVAPLESSPLYHERLATQYIEYDVELANKHLDNVLPEKDADGFRLGPDGERFSIIMTVADSLSYGTKWVQIAELLSEYWAAVGVEVVVNGMHNDQFDVRFRDNDIEASIYTGEGGAGITAILDPRYFVPMEWWGIFGNGWYAWRVGANDFVQVEPPQHIKDIREKYETEVLGAPTQEAQIEAMKEILAIAADEFWVIGISRPSSGYDPSSARLKNIRDNWIGGWIEGVQKITYPEQWYLE